VVDVIKLFYLFKF